MTRDDVISLAREAGLSNDFGKLGYPYLPELERFAELVAATERKWIGLTDDEVMVLNRRSYDAQIGLLPLTFYRAIEKALKEKNSEPN